MFYLIILGLIILTKEEMENSYALLQYSESFL